jgi:hypothetical protein
MLTTTTERAVAALAVLLGLGLLPVLPAGVPVLVAALAAPIALYVEGCRQNGTRNDPPEENRNAAQEEDR